MFHQITFSSDAELPYCTPTKLLLLLLLPLLLRFAG
jgi:hypothetical protein